MIFSLKYHKAVINGENQENSHIDNILFFWYTMTQLKGKIMMSNFGKSVEIDRIIDDDGMYLTLEEFKIVMQYLITSLIFNTT